ncbi:glycoside hydrolase family 3 C-terminal domain-containing protein [Nocardia carnea]|uniref:glycoside hydrolase family 3 C-terminal domain-containing protein n=1 Tax=Nocardia carnea TaxID=37328 RepID=UPI0024552A7A|nr:glycoside hydrolase family 3 C-terminal domain-containing protein [Nocardia carnea]
MAEHNDRVGIRRATADLTLEEKAALLCGRGAWDTTAIERLGIPSIVLTDGPHGLRLQDPGTRVFEFEKSLPATCFPTAAALGSSWDVVLLARVGATLGAESAASGVAVLLGPGVNIKRTPLCGRNFEYLSEDPLLSGHLGAALVRGIQSRGVGASVKHFAANNQETDRMRISAEIDERTLREIYLPAFEHTVTQARPWTVMASYNRLNGVFASQNPWLLTEVLRKEWGFDGAVVSDWGAVTDPVSAVAAGLDLEMPSTNGMSAARLIHAVKRGLLEENALDQAVTRVLELVDRAMRTETLSETADLDAHHTLAREAAADSAVLLKNDHAILPLDPGADMRVAVIGEFARTPRFQGAGSSQINPTRLDNAWGALESAAGDRLRLSFSPGFTLSGDPDSTLLPAAVSAAGSADVAVIFLGLPEGKESEGFDRTDIDLPAQQVRVLEAVAAVNPAVVVVLANGGVIRVAPWAHHCRAILEGWLSGQAGGGAIADLLFGRVNPSGRLAETIPLRLQDTPSYLNFPGADGSVRYGERLYVGYRYFDTKEIPVGYPFGHGLSYTTFDYSNLQAEVDGHGDNVAVRLRLTLTNTGSRAGKEVIQVYVHDLESSVDRPVRELKAFTKTGLEPAQSTTVEFELCARDLSFYSPAHRRWLLESGDFEISVGASSRDLRLTTVITVDAPAPVAPLTMDSLVREWLDHPTGGPAFRRALAQIPNSSFTANPDILTMVESLPMTRMLTMSGGHLDPELLNEALD